MKIENITHKKVKAELLGGGYVDHGFGGEYDFKEVIASAGLDETLRYLSARDLSLGELSEAAQKIKFLLLASMEDVADELVESWDE